MCPNPAVDFLIRRLITGPAWAVMIAAALSTNAPGVSAHGADSVEPAPGYGNLAYTPPPAGSYELPSLGDAPDGVVLDEQGRRQRLHDLFAGHVVVLSFIYTHCSDVNGCPLSTAVLYMLKTALGKDPVLADKVRLISLSFDPDRDTPKVMRAYGANFKSRGGDWRFLTTATETDLKPILDGYGQSIVKERDASGKLTGDFSHFLRVFLIDADRHIRNMYSVSFLHKDILLNDIRTVVLASGAGTGSTAGPRAVRVGPGDDKSGYDSAGYSTRSESIAARRGRSADLMANVTHPPLGLPPEPQPEDNPVTRAKVALGRKLFYDRRLSLNGTISCAMCHIPEQGFSNNELATAVGIEGRTVRRNAPTLYNVAYATRLFHDGRENRLEQQIWSPMLASNEMGNPSIAFVVDKLKTLPDYRNLFEQAFNGRTAGMETTGMAIASYERTLNSADSPFDRWLYGKDEKAISSKAREGYRLFTGRAGCSGCHIVGRTSALFTDYGMHNTGIGYYESMHRRTADEKVQLAPGESVKVAGAVIDSVGAPPPGDLGLYEITQDPKDRWKYKTPTLRNVALTAPYMHNGSLATLRAVVEFYNRGGIPNELLDPAIHPLGLTPAQEDALVAFLESLTGSNVGVLTADAFAAPIGDPESE